MSNPLVPSEAEVVALGADILAKGMSRICHSLCCICFDTGIYINYGTTERDSGVSTGTLEELAGVFETVAEKAASVADRHAVRDFLDLRTLRDRLAAKPVLNLACRSVDGKWTSAQFILTESDEVGLPLKALYISEAVTVQKQGDILGLISSRDGFRDPITGLINRAGYELLIADAAHGSQPVAYALVDVDNFKEINDSYGHAAGDAVLTQVADALRAITRKGDDVARIGGDEFAVILNGCPIGAADRILAKFEEAQRALSSALPDGKAATLSVGVCFSPAGFDEATIEHADDAMYEVKHSGRGGCALADETGNVFRKWLDHSVERRMDIAFTNTVGSWRIEMPDDGSPRRMFCDDAMLRIAGEKRRSKPEEVYERWRSGLAGSDADTIDATLERLSENGEQVHASFAWKNGDGESFSIVSSVARDRGFVGGKCYFGYFDLSCVGNVRRRESGVELLNEALARSLAFGYVLDLETGTYSTLRQPASGPLAFIKADGPTVSLANAMRRFIADDEGKAAFEGMFDKATMPARLAGIDHIACDFLSNGVQGWCRAKLYTFKAGGFDGLEKVILVGESIEVEKPSHYEELDMARGKGEAGKGGRVLVVDDEELNRVILEDALSSDFEVVCACDGTEAYEIVSKKPEAFVGIVTDLSMPKMGGEELLAKLQEDGICNDIPVVVVTAEDKVDAENRCLSHGAIDFMRKPFHVAVAKKRVNNVVDLFKYQNHLRVEVERRTEELQRVCDELEDKSMWLREYAYRLSETSASMIEALGEIVEFRSVEAGTHVARVKRYTHALAEHLLEMDPDCGLTEETVQLITDASPLHDVGKVGIPDAVLLKPGRLTDEEFEVMKTHAALGYKLLSSLDSTWQDGYRTMCEEICLCHHERYDGSGYPNGLKGEEIPLSAQIVSIADVFDALSSDRVYRPALSRAETYKLIMEGKVGAFSDRLLKCFEETFPQLEQIAEQIEKGE